MSTVSIVNTVSTVATVGTVVTVGTIGTEGTVSTVGTCLINSVLAVPINTLYSSLKVVTKPFDIYISEKGCLSRQYTIS